MRPETKDKLRALAQKRLDLIERLRTNPSGLAWCAENTQIADEVVETVYGDAFDGSSRNVDVALVATGGFGRRELCPYSDIDITVVPSDEASHELDRLIRSLFQDLHWAFCTALRLDVGYAYRLISDSPGLDAKTRTGLMDMRLVAGSRTLYRQLDGSLQANFPVGEFLLAKIEERAEMYRRFNDTPLVIEPQIKEGAGGLRDFHCANWISEAKGEQPSRPSPSYDTMVRYRNLLHLVVGKHHDLLSRARQAEIGDVLGMSPEQIQIEVSTAGAQLHRHFCRAKEKLHEGRLPLSSSTLAVNGEVRVLPTSTAGEAAVGIAFASKLGLRVSDLPMRAGSSYGGPPAAFAIATGEDTLRNLDRCSLLDQLLPELTACRVLASQDTVHTYTVFEHTLRVIGLLDSIPPGEFLGQVKASVTDLEALYLAALLHDTGKIDPSADHSEAGALIARDVCRRWDLAASLEETVVWLVREHLSMERFIRIRDLMQPGTIEEFLQVVGDAERLKLLTLLTWADVNAVAQGTWTKTQDAFLRQLFEGAMYLMENASGGTPDPSVSQQRLLRQIKKEPGDETRIADFLQSLPAHYLASTPDQVVKLHFQLALRASGGETTVEHLTRNDLAATEITVCTLDHPGLLSQILGVLYGYDLSVIGIRACTTSSKPPVAVDVFTVSFGGRVVPPATMAHLARSLHEIIDGKTPLDGFLRSKGKDPERGQQVFKYKYINGHPGILEIRAPRGRGMAFRFSRLFAAQGWNIIAARVGQWAGTGAAAFYLTDQSGRPLNPDHVRSVLDRELNME